MLRSVFLLYNPRSKSCFKCEVTGESDSETNEVYWEFPERPDGYFPIWLSKQIIDDHGLVWWTVETSLAMLQGKSNDQGLFLNIPNGCIIMPCEGHTYPATGVKYKRDPFATVVFEIK